MVRLCKENWDLQPVFRSWCSVLFTSQRSAIACEGQKAFISCDDFYSGIQIKSAMYGRQNSTICVDPKRPSSSSSFCQEQEPDVKAQVSGLCQGEYKCEVTAADSLLARRGIAVCPAVSKYLQISYRCVLTGENRVRAIWAGSVGWYYCYTTLVYTTQVTSAFCAIWFASQSRDIKYYSPPGGIWRKKAYLRVPFYQKIKHLFGNCY